MDGFALFVANVVATLSSALIAALLCLSIFLDLRRGRSHDPRTSDLMSDTTIPNLTINPEIPDLRGVSFSYCIRILKDFERLREKEECTGFPSFIHFIQECEGPKRAVENTISALSTTMLQSSIDGPSAKIYKIYEFLQFEGYFYKKSLEEFPQHARVLGQKLIAEVIANDSFAQNCTVCNNSDKEMTWTVTECGHFFHKDCLWSERSSRKCPSCYEDLGRLYHI
jgi:hypothetical protein